jgi:[ribosomal protein S18]-alanine N-acetyltransferase
MEIVKITSTNELRACARMMVAAPPWSTLRFELDQCLEDLSHSHMQVHAAVNTNSEIAGFLASMENGIGFEPIIEYLCVKEDLRGKGIGTSLINYFEDVLYPKADNLYMFVSDINPSAARLYIRLGYLQVGALPNFNLMQQTEFLHRKSRRPKQSHRFNP